MSGMKRRMEELGTEMVTAVVGDVVARTMSAAVSRYEAHASVDDKLERLGMLAVMVHSAVEAAEGVHIRNWWLRRWLWRLRDAALDADELLRLFRRRRAREEAAAAAATAGAGAQSRNTLWISWSAAWRALRSAKSLLFGGGDGGVDVERLSRMVERLETEAMGLGDFLKMLELEIRRWSLPVQPEPEPSVTVTLQVHASLVRKDGAAGFETSEAVIYQHRRQKPSAGVEDDRLPSISDEEYVAGVREMGQLILRRRIRRALEKLIIWKQPPVAPPPPAAWSTSRPPDPDRLRGTVARIRQAVVGARGSTSAAEFHGGERPCWLALWHDKLKAVADGAERALTLADGADVVTTTPGHDDAGDDGGGLRRSARSVEAAAAHLEDFVTLAGLARTRGQMQTPWRHGGSRDLKGTRLWMFLPAVIILIVTICLLLFGIKTRTLRAPLQ